MMIIGAGIAVILGVAWLLIVAVYDLGKQQGRLDELDYIEREVLGVKRK